MVQLVRDTVAVATLGETRHHAGRVRHSMTALTRWNRLVFVLVAGNTEYVLVFCITAGKHLERALMAGCTHLVGCIGRHEYRRRHMRLVAFFTLRSNHVRTVWFVALRTERNLAVNSMAEAARQTAVLALDLLQLDVLFGMTGQTLFGDVVGQLDDLGGMRVVVAAKTAGQVVVRLAGMALAAGRDNLSFGRRMTCMAILAANTRFVRSAAGCNVGRRSSMTLDAVCCQ